jgi:hypothetical protein
MELLNRLAVLLGRGIGVAFGERAGAFNFEADLIVTLPLAALRLLVKDAVRGLDIPLWDTLAADERVVDRDNRVDVSDGVTPFLEVMFKMSGAQPLRTYQY